MKKEYEYMNQALKKLYKNGYRYLVRDGDGSIYAYDEPPIKATDEEFWHLDRNRNKMIERLVFVPDFFNECLGFNRNNVFPTVRWENTKPTAIKELMRELEQAPFRDWLTDQYRCGARWITRDCCGDVWVYHEKPIKKTEVWDSFDWCASPSYSGNDVMKSMEKVSFLPKWEDEEPTKIKDIIEQYDNKGE